MPPSGDRIFKIFEEILLDVRVDNNGEVNDDDIVTIYENGKKLVSSSTNPKVQKMYKTDQDLWHMFVKRKTITNEMQNQTFTEFLKSLKSRYAPSALWLVYSCVNSYVIDTCWFNLKGYPRLSKFLKNMTANYVATKSRTFSVEQIYDFLLHC